MLRTEHTVVCNPCRMGYAVRTLVLPNIGFGHCPAFAKEINFDYKISHQRGNTSRPG